jgi:hypothetical protein
MTGGSGPDKSGALAKVPTVLGIGRRTVTPGGLR